MSKNSQDSSDITEDEKFWNRIFRNVSTSVGRHVRTLGTALDFRVSELEAIELNHTMYGTEEVAFQILVTWRRREGTGATLAELAEVLGNIGRKDIAEEILASQPKSLKRNDEHLSGIWETIKTSLQFKNTKQKIPKIPWLDWDMDFEEYYVDLNIQSKHGVEYSDIHLQDIFKERNEKIQTNILIEGPAGSGKSTLASKLCFDHGNGEEYIRRFDAVILLRLREMTLTLEELITSTLNLKGYKGQEVLEAIRENDDRLLLILDGFDEMHPSKQTVVAPLLKKEQWPRSTIIVTSREASIPLLTKTPDPSFSNLLHCMDMRVVIRGLTGNNKMLFLQSYLKHSPKKMKSTLELIEKMFALFPYGKIFDCPLFLLLLVIVAEEEEVHFNSLNTKTGLFKTLFNFLLKRMFAKPGEINPKCDFFEYDFDNLPAYVHFLSQFGSLALRKQYDDNPYLYTGEELRSHCGSEDILKLGILYQNENKPGLKRKSWYEPMHRTILEFSMAYHLWVSRKSGSEPVALFTAQEIGPTVYYNRESLIFYFICGLFGKDLGTLFSLMGSGHESEQWLDKYIRTYSPQQLAEESQLQLSELADAFLPLVPNVYTVPGVLPTFNDFLKEILVNAKRKGKLKYVIYDPSHSDKAHSENWHNIITHQIGYISNSAQERNDYKIFAIRLTTLTDQQVEELKSRFIMEDVLEGVPFYEVRGYGSGFADTLPKISQCIREDTVESGTLNYYQDMPLEQWEEFFQSAKESKNLSDVSILGRHWNDLFVNSINATGDLSSFCRHSLSLGDGYRDFYNYVFIQNETASEVHNLRYMFVTTDKKENEDRGFTQKLNYSFLEVLGILFIRGREYAFTSSRLVSMIRKYSSLQMIEFWGLCSDEFVRDFLQELLDGNHPSGILQLNTLSLNFSVCFILEVSQNTLELLKNALQSRKLRSMWLSSKVLKYERMQYGFEAQKQIYCKRLQFLKAFPESQGFVHKLSDRLEYDEILHSQYEHLYHHWIEPWFKSCFIEITVNER